MIEANQIQKYRKKSISSLIKLATLKFNAFIRERDKGKGCISCQGKVTEAGHYLSAGHNAHVRFNEMNVNGQCTRCNRWLHGNLIEYRKGLVKRYGHEKVELLEGMQKNFKWDRFSLIEIILKFK